MCTRVHSVRTVLHVTQVVRVRNFYTRPKVVLVLSPPGLSVSASSGSRHAVPIWIILDITHESVPFSLNHALFVELIQ